MLGSLHQCTNASGVPLSSVGGANWQQIRGWEEVPRNAQMLRKHILLLVWTSALLQPWARADEPNAQNLANPSMAPVTIRAESCKRFIHKLKPGENWIGLAAYHEQFADCDPAEHIEWDFSQKNIFSPESAHFLS